ncbi:MAG: response regulator transcription factor [Bacillota bacterium]|uniref:Heme response regulator HssR n=1 Tax=Virgibacillus salarius TaxID=447199 RepID=A0A941DV23_9BACI|nr:MULTISPECIES: response regulator transcription factor [Bacillaceae]NAZ09909.1 response regulator [Agaribacter marinus]MBR7797200.1 response regulator transcription factor [Virgibacillus salarius]MCC2251798.1 response regulator transcription factor [Virgibacillus sp. AGTR]MDY7045976.1 response regulator transcription factor [Virgibacillus sp. M23]QRZ19253.1 response regulator transcription factor [Virgibacillus sp. AGTR]
MITILTVDDDAHIRELLRFYLQKEGYQIIEAEDGQAALKQLAKRQVHLAIVDIMMPQIDGYQLCKEIRTDYDIPVLMLTAKGELTDKEKAYMAGTDDYIVKPFEPKEVLFRIKALLRRFQMQHNEKIQLGNTVIDRKSYEVHTQGKTIILPLKEFELLAQLASYPNRIFSREQLIELVWGSDYPGNDRTVDVHIKRLRERFTSVQNDFSIQTIRGLGYKLEFIRDAGVH